MVYKVIGLMSGSSLDGLDIAYVHIQETGGKWSYEFIHTDCYTYPEEWIARLSSAINLSARDYLQLNIDYGHYTGSLINLFIEQHGLYHKVHLIASHGHTSFHFPETRMTAQLGDGASIAAETGLAVVSDLRSMDLAFGGQGAPLVPTGEKYLLPQYDYLLNLGGIANISHRNEGNYIAFDICAANRVLNLLSNELGHEFDEDGAIAASGTLDPGLLSELNSLEYYGKAYPKSLDNGFGVNTVYPIIARAGLSIPDALHTYSEHIAEQIVRAFQLMPAHEKAGELLITGGGAFNKFLVERLQYLLAAQHINVVVPEKDLVQYKEALIMALLGVLRWREEPTVMSSVTGATKDSIGGSLWLGS